MKDKTLYLNILLCMVVLVGLTIACIVSTPEIKFFDNSLETESLENKKYNTIDGEEKDTLSNEYYSHEKSNSNLEVAENVHYTEQNTSVKQFIILLIVIIPIMAMILNPWK